MIPDEERASAELKAGTAAQQWQVNPEQPRRATDLRGLVAGDGEDAPALGVGGLGQPPLLDEERGLLLGAREDPLRLLLGALHDALGLLVDALRGSYLFGHGDTQLVE